ncbi:MAG: CRISPR-associated helicase Cas3' [Eubacteriales bacterium]|nr:CRISPR-associated helicase Cas3' [Eubacteriales bacterium]
MEYIAHISEDKSEIQTVKEHAEGTALLAKDFASAFGYGEWGYCCGMLHDIGKYSAAFQERIRGSSRIVDHATAGAQLCSRKKGLYPLLSYCIAGHHAGLPDTGAYSDDGSCGSLLGRLKKKVQDYQAYQEEIDIPELTKLPFHTGNKEKDAFVMSVFIRMLYSCLVDADFFDTEYFMNHGKTHRCSGESMDILLDRLNMHIADWLKNDDTDTVNGRRTEILKNCRNWGEADKGMFRLTVPTGGGKTVASLAFALAHCAEHQMDRIIYVIPYTSIIEQNAKVFRDILGEENVLENHCNVDYESEEELKPFQLASENWDKPVVVTTNVQFFESLFSNKSSRCRKLHNIANSVIIFDEAQMLPNDYLKPCVAMIEELVSRYECSAVLCTATQPALQPFFSQNLNIVELCPRMEEQFRFFKRVTINNKGALSEEALVEILREERQALCILNTKRKVQKIYQELKGDGVYHLSTFMYPLHRRRVLEEIKKRLSNGEKCIVIATSLVEAGVDLDFRTVYRQLAGVDSLIQAAGRCNREGKRTAAESMAHVFQLEGEEAIPGQSQQIASAKYLMEEEDDITSPEAVRKYFEILYHYRGESLDKKGIMGQFRPMYFPFASVSEQFKLIEQNTKSIFIAGEDEAIQILHEIQLKGATRALMRKAGKYVVNVYENDFDRLHEAGMLTAVSEEMKEEFFMLRDNSLYSDDMGLMTDRVDRGSAILV